MSKTRYPAFLILMYRFWDAFSHQSYGNPLVFLKNLLWYFSDLIRFSFLHQNKQYRRPLSALYPCIADKTSNTPLDAVYFFQDAWGAGQIFSYHPRQHVDVGSRVSTVGILSQFVPTTFVDIRPISVKLVGLKFKQGTILDLPFESDSVESLSSLCVAEHIGLGRYGDPLDAFGSEKAFKELWRVVAPGGHLLISVPVEEKNTVYFKAHRSFHPQYVKQFFPGGEVQEERYIYGSQLHRRFSAEKGFGIMLLHIQKGKGTGHAY